MKRPSASRASMVVMGLLSACGGGQTPSDAATDATRHDVPLVDTVPPTGDAPSTDAAVDALADAPSDSGPDALPHDAATDGPLGTDAGRDAASDASACGDARFCEPFDTYPTVTGAITNNQHFGPWRAALSASGSTMVLDSMHTVSAPRALHVHIDNGATAGGRLFSNGTLPVIAGNPTHLYGRMMMYIDPNGTSIHWTFFGVNGPAEPGSHMMSRTASYILSSLPHAGVNTYSFVYGLQAMGSDPYHDCSSQSMSSMPTARWTCVAFEMDSVARRIRLYLDGSTTPALSLDDHGRACVTGSQVDNPWYGPSINQFFAGAWSFHAMNAPLDVWIDDVVLDTAPVSCPAAH